MPNQINSLGLDMNSNSSSGIDANSNDQPGGDPASFQDSSNWDWNNAFEVFMNNSDDLLSVILQNKNATANQMGPGSSGTNGFTSTMQKASMDKIGWIIMVGILVTLIVVVSKKGRA